MIGICTRMLLVTLVVTLFLADSEAGWWGRRRNNPPPPPPPTTTPAPVCGGCTGTPSAERACRQTRTVSRPTPVQTCTGWWRRRCRIVYPSRNYVGERYTCCSGYVLANGMCHRGGTISQHCGKSNYTDSASRGTSAMIVGGTSARPNEFPWMVSLRTSPRGHFCGGSILNANWILTAAHCVIGKSASSFSVYAGEHQLSTTESTQRIHSVNKVRIYSGYSHYTLLHDIALVRVSTPIALNADRFPICLPADSDVYSSNPWYIMGWGRTSTTGPVSNTLLYARAYESARSRCHYARLDQNDVCVTDNSGDDDRSACSGDSGGPLVHKGSYYTTLGVVSFGNRDGCAARHPTAFTKVGPYLQWIYGFIL